MAWASAVMMLGGFGMHGGGLTSLPCGFLVWGLLGAVLA